MSDVGGLAIRMIVSLGLVLALVAVAYQFARRRQNGGGLGLPTSQRRRNRNRATANRPLEVEARAGLSRGSSAVAVRFADRIVLVGVTEGAPSSVLAEIDVDEWDRAQESDDEDAEERMPLDPNSVVTPRPSFLDALRDATSRRG